MAIIEMGHDVMQKRASPIHPHAESSEWAPDTIGSRGNLIPLHNGLIVVRFHGGFLNGRIARSNDTRTGGFVDFWNAEAVYLHTSGKVGVGMLGPSPESWYQAHALADRCDTITMDKMYRMTAWDLRDGTLERFQVNHSGSRSAGCGSGTRFR